MAVDGIILDKVVTQLKAQLPFRVNKIQQISTNEILFGLRINGINENLIVSCHSLYNRINLTKANYPTGITPSQFVLNLRKHLEGGTIYDIKQGGLDRYLYLEVAHRNEIKDKEILKVYIELMGKYANIILVNEDNKIIDALKKIPPFENTKRTIQKGANFNLYDLQDKKDPFTNFDFDTNQPLHAQFHGFSPILSKEILYRINHNQNFKDIMNEIKDSQNLFISNDKEDIFHVIPLTHTNSEFKKMALDEGFDYIYALKEEKERIKQATGDLYKVVSRNLKQLNNKLPKLYHSLDEALDCDKWKEYGDLLFTYGNFDTNGQTSITLNDYSDNQITIPLDAKLNRVQNANKYYTKYQKNRKAQQHLTQQIQICEDEIEYFKAIDEQLEIANFEDAKEIKEDLINNRYLRAVIKPSHKKPKKIKINVTTINFKDQIITFGKNNIQNDYVTFKLANKNDTWFHAKDYHGAHVIVNNSEPDEDTIRLCANIAAYYSKGRLSSSVPVNYCLARNLKKIPKSQLGLVQLTNYKTIYIDPDYAQIELLIK